ncbi:uncharacterized protein METZ01_LOCUS214985, partial [marine metagenome]
PSFFSKRNEKSYGLSNSTTSYSRPQRINQSIGSFPEMNSTTQISNNFQGNSSRDTLASGVGPQMAADESGNLYSLVSYDASGDGYLDMVLYKSTDNGATWAQEVYVYNSTADLVDGDVEVINNYFLWFYNNNGTMRIFWAHQTNWPNGDYGTVTLTVDAGWESAGLWGSILADKFYYEIASTWTYVVWYAYNDSTDEDRIFYSMSQDSARTWSSPVTVSTDTVSYFRPGLALAYSTPEAGTSVDHAWTTWSDADGNTKVASIDVYTDSVETHTVMTAGEHYDFYQAPSISAYYDELLVMSGVEWDTSYGFGNDMDIAMTFSVDDGENWGSTYDWYYWGDITDYPDAWDYAAAPAFSSDGVVGFSMAKGYYQDDDVLYLSNNTSDFLSGWSSPAVVQEGLTEVYMTASTIVGTIFNLAYDDYQNEVVYYASYDLGAVQTGGTVTGQVTDAVTGYAISGATVTIYTETTTTDGSGNYTITGIPPAALEANFFGQPLEGEAPLSVQFYNNSTEGFRSITVSKEDYATY